MSNNKLNSGITQKYLVSFQEQELVWNKYVAEVDATNEADAFEKLNKVIEDGLNPHSSFDCLQIGSSDSICSDNKFITEEEDAIVIEIPNSDLFTFLNLSIMDIARFGQDELYSIVESKFNNDIEILDMELFQFPNSEPSVDEVSIKCIITEHKFKDILFTNNKPNKLYRPTVDAIKKHSLKLGSNDFWVNKNELLESFGFNSNEIFAITQEMIFEYEIFDSENVFTVKGIL